MGETISLHHLPRRTDNLFYIFALLLSPLFNLLVSATTFARLQSIAINNGGALHREHWVFSLAQFLLAGILIFLIVNLARTVILRHQRIRKTLLVFGLLSTLYLLLNLFTISYAIYSARVGSFFLLGISLGIYLSLNLIFFFWYWFVDYPTQVRHLHHQDHLCGIWFPQEALSANPRWLPGPIDYLFFTVMTSNTLGPPENHTTVGNTIKLIQLVHSLVMLVMLVLIVSRAVNSISG